MKPIISVEANISHVKDVVNPHTVKSHYFQYLEICTYSHKNEFMQEINNDFLIYVMFTWHVMQEKEKVETF